METHPRSRQVAALFDRVADTYDQVDVPWFQPIARRLVQALAPTPGERALDLGCGRGAATLPLAQAVGAQGRVVALDLAAGMVEATRREAAGAGLTNVEVHERDVADPGLPAGSFDLAASSLVLFFLPEPGAALREWCRLLRPGGRLGVATFGPDDDVGRAVDALFRPFLPPQLLDARTSGTAGPFASDAGVAALFEDAGLVEVTTSHGEVEAEFDDVDHWSRWSHSHGQRVFWDFLPADRHDEVVSRAGELLERRRRPGGRIVLTQQLRFTVGRRPHPAATRRAGTADG
jgi:ubiquinone/menaquinone biosynthesis C-methylase UbiE